MKPVQLFLFFSLYLVPSYMFAAQPTPQSKTEQNFGPRKIYCGLYVKYLDPNQPIGQCYADLYWWSKTEKRENDDLESLAEATSLEFVNAIDVHSREVVESKLIRDEKGTEFFYQTGVVKAVFGYQTDFSSYPWDSQNILFELESPKFVKKEVELILDEKATSEDNWLDPKISVNGFSIHVADATSLTSKYQTNFGDNETAIQPKYSRLTFSITLKRRSSSFLTKILIPNILLALVAYLVFFIPAESLDVAVGCTVTSLLATIALQITLNDDLPDTGYTTSSDHMFHLFFFAITLALVQTVATYKLEKIGKEKMADRLEIAGRYGFPSMLAIGLVVIWLSS